jgi:hypothetical protein
MLKLG